MANENLYTNLEQLELLAQRTKDAIPVKVSDLTNDANYQTGDQVDAKIAAQVSSLYRFKGSKASSELTSALLDAAHLNFVYNITNAFTTTADFVEGAGKKHPAGTNVAIVNTGTDETPVYKFDVMGGDMAGYQSLIENPTADHLATTDGNGQTQDSGIAADDVVTKNASAVSGNVAAFDANGKPMTDGGVAASNIMQKVSNATAGNFATLNANGEVLDSGMRPATNTEVNTMLDRVFGSNGNAGA